MKDKSSFLDYPPLPDERRQLMIQEANNPEDPNRNICALAVAKLFGAEDKTEYLHTEIDLLQAVELAGWDLRSFTIESGELSTPLVQEVISFQAFTRAEKVIVFVEDHVLAFDFLNQGTITIDTAPEYCIAAEIRGLVACNRKQEVTE